MKTILSLVVLMLFCNVQILQAQVYLFESTQSALPGNDVDGKHEFNPSNMKFQFNFDELIVKLFDGATNEVLNQQSFEKDIDILVKPEHTEYIFYYDLLNFILVIDYKDSDTEDELQFFEFTDEIVHLKGKFQKVNHKKQ